MKLKKQMKVEHHVQNFADYMTKPSKGMKTLAVFVKGKVKRR